MPGYNLYYCNSNTSVGGSAIYVTENIKCQPLSQTKIKVNGCEDVWVELTLENNDTLIVGSFYKHPNSTISDLRTFEDAFVSIIKSFKTNQKYLVLGDLNIHYDKMDTSKHIDDYINHINCIGCLQLINKPTRICTTCSSIIDHVYINATFANDVSTVILQEDVSDLLPLCVKYCCAPTIKTSQRPYIRRITLESIEPFSSNLDDALLSPDMLHSIDLEKLLNLISGLANQHFPKKKSKVEGYMKWPRTLGSPQTSLH